MNLAFGRIRSTPVKPAGAVMIPSVAERSGAPLQALSNDLALIFGPLDVQAVRASLVDLESMACPQSWRITEDGEMVDDPVERGPNGWFRSAMATIVQLNRAPFEQTLTRNLDPRRWAFAWRIDERHVAVAEVRYRQPRAEQTDVDTALVRQVCDAGIRAFRTRPPAATSGRQPAAGPGAKAARPAPLLGLPRRVVAGVLVACLAAAAVLFALRQQAATLVQLQSIADATMTQMLAGTLASGDDRDVQAGLASFARLRYFHGALVTDGQRRVIASAGDAPGARLGEPVSPALAASARTIDLGGVGGQRDGQLLVWGAPARAPWGGGVLVDAALVAALVVGAGAGLVLLAAGARGQRAGTETRRA